MHEINFIDKTFNKDSAGNYSISIQANNIGLVYCISDDKTNSYILFRKHRFEQVLLPGDLMRSITAILESDETLNLRFRRVRFLGYTQQSTLVPESFFDRNFMSEYLKFNQSEQTDQDLFNNYISPPGLYNVFALPHEMVSLVTKHFKKVEFMNQTTPFLRHIVNIQSSALPKATTYLSLNPDFFDIACTGKGNLLLYNTFQYTNDHDLLYYIAFVYKQAGFDMREVPLIISGELCSKSNYFEILKEYIPHSVYNEAACIPSLSQGLKQVNITRFLNLLNLQMCASSGEHMAAEK